MRYETMDILIEEKTLYKLFTDLILNWTSTVYYREINVWTYNTIIIVQWIVSTLYGYFGNKIKYLNVV